MEKILPVKYKSQWDADAVKTANDCGPTSVAMILNYYGENLTSDQVFAKTGAGSGLISFSQLKAAIAAFGYSYEVLTNCTPEKLKSYIDQDMPVVALVHYGSLTSTQDKSFKGGHFFTVVGYRDDCYFVNDPNFRGDLRAHGDHHSFTKTEFEKAWRDCSIDSNPVNSLIIIKRKAGQTSANKGTMQIESNLFDKLVGNSGKWDKTVQYLELVTKPDDTPFEDAQRVVAGFKSRVTDLQNQLNTANSEVGNRTEQVSRLKEQLVSEEKLKNDLTTKLNSSVKNYSDVGTLYEGKLAQLQSQVDAISKEKGNLNGQVVSLTQDRDSWKEKYQTLLSSQTAQLTLADAIRLIFSALLSKAKEIKLSKEE